MVMVTSGVCFFLSASDCWDGLQLPREPEELRTENGCSESREKRRRDPSRLRVARASNNRRCRNNHLISGGASRAFVTLRSPTATLLRIRARFVWGGGRRRLQTLQNIFSISSKYQTVGGVIWLGDPALAAGGAEWRGLTSCLPGRLQAEESRERESEKGRGDGQQRTRASESHTHSEPNWHQPAAILPSPTIKYVWAICFFTPVNKNEPSAAPSERTPLIFNTRKSPRPPQPLAC